MAVIGNNNLLFTGRFNPQPVIQQAAAAGQAAGRAFYGSFGRSSLPFRDFKKFEDSIDSAAARVIAFTATTSLIYGLGNAMRRLTTDAIKIESVMARIGSITGDSADELKRFQGEIFKLANLTSTSFEDAASAAEEFSRQGLKLNETLDATKAALAIAKLSGTSAKAAIEGLTATISTFGAKAGTYTEVANKLLALDAKFATSAGGIIQGLTRVAGVAEQAGLSIDETASAITALKQVTGRSEAVLGNSLKSIFVSLQSEKIIRDLRGIGVEVENSDGSFRDLIPVVRDLSKAFDGLSDSQQSAITQKVAGKYQSNAFTGLLKAFRSGGEFDKALATSTGSGENLEKRLDAIFGTTEAGLQRLSNKITEFGGKVGTKLGKPIVDAFSESFTKVLDAGQSLFTEGGKGLGDSLVGGVVNVLKGPGAALLGIAFAKLLTRLSTDAGLAIRSIVGVGAQKRKNAEIDQFALTVLQNMNAVESQRILNLKSVEQRQQAIALAMEQQITAARALSLVMPGGFNAALLPRAGNPFTGRMSRGEIYSGVRDLKNRASGDVPERNAMIREAVAIRNGVGGARPSARPKVEYLNLGNGREKVVVNTDEKVIKNYAGSGQDAVLNRKMMGYAGGAIPKRFNAAKIINSGGTISKANKPTLEGIRSIMSQAGLPSNFSTQAELSSILGQKSSKRALYSYLKANPISISRLPGNHNEIADGNHRYYLADLAGIKNIPTLAKGKLTRKQLEAEQKKLERQFRENQNGLENDSKRRLAIVKKRGYNGIDTVKQVGTTNPFGNPGNPLYNALKGVKVPPPIPKFDLPKLQLVSPQTQAAYFDKSIGKALDTTVKKLEAEQKTIRAAEQQAKQSRVSAQIPGALAGAQAAQTRIAVQAQTRDRFRDYRDKPLYPKIGPIPAPTPKSLGVPPALSRKLAIIDRLQNPVRSGFNKFSLSAPNFPGAAIGSGSKSPYGSVPISAPLLPPVAGLTGAQYNLRTRPNLSSRPSPIVIPQRPQAIPRKALPIPSKPGAVVATSTPVAQSKFVTPSFNPSAVQAARQTQATTQAAKLPRPTPSAKQTYSTSRQARIANLRSTFSVATSGLKLKGPDKIQQRIDAIDKEAIRKDGKLNKSDTKFIQKLGYNRLSANANEQIQRRQQRSDRIRGGIAGAGFAASFIGGSIAQQATDDQGRETSKSRRIGGISNAVSIAAISSTLGPAAPIGYAVAGIIALNAALDEGPDKLNAYKDKLSGLQKSYQEQEQAIESYLSNFEQFSSAIRDGSAVAAEAAKRSLALSLRGVKDEGLKSKLKGAITQESIAEFVQQSKIQNERSVSAAASLVEVQKLIDADPKGYFSGKSVLNEDEKSDLGTKLSAILDTSKISKEDVEKIRYSTRDTNLKGIFDKTAPREFGEAIDRLSTNFRGSSDVLYYAGQKVIEIIDSEKQAVELLAKSAEQQQKQFDFRSALSGRLSQTGFSEFQKGLKKSSAISTLEQEIELLKPSLSEAAQATIDFRLETIKLTNSLDEEATKAFSSIAQLVSQEATKTPITGDQYNKIASSVESFQQTRDFGKLIESLKGLAPSAVDSIQSKGVEILQDLREQNERIIENTKQSALAAKNRIAQIQYNQRASLFGGGAIAEDISETLKTIRRGRDAANGPKIYNRYENPNLSNGQTLYRGNIISSPTAAQRAKAAGQYSGAVTARSRAVIQGLEASKGAGFLGLDLDPNSAAGKAQESLRAQRRQRYGSAVAPILKENQTRELLGTFDSITGSIASDQKRKIGYSAINRVSKDARNDIINGDYSAAIEKLKVGRGNLDEAGSRDPEIGAKLDELIKEIQVSAELAKVIPQAAKEAADRFEPKNQLDVFKSALQTLEGQEAQSISLLSSIRTILDEQKKGADIATSESRIRSFQEALGPLRVKAQQGQPVQDELNRVKTQLGNELISFGGKVSPGVFSPVTLTNNSLGKLPGSGVLAPPPDISQPVKKPKFVDPEFEAEAAKTRKEMDAIKAEQKAASDVNLKTESKIDLSFSGFKDIFTSKEVAESISSAIMPLVKQYVADYVKTGGKVAYA